MHIKELKSSIAVVGMGCLYPGAHSLRELWENILAKRQQFRRFPDNRLSINEYFDADPTTPDKTYATRAAVINGFQFDWANRRIPRAVAESTDVVHWLGLEVACQALTDAGYTRENVPTERSGVIIGNTLTGEQTRSNSLRTRWPYVRRALRAAAEARKLPHHQIEELVGTMEEYFKSVFAPITEDTLAGGLSNTIAGRICNFLNFKGGGYTVDGACSSSLIAIATAAKDLTHGDLDFALAGGVDISLDTFEMIGFAKTKALTKNEMRVYDRRASGFIPGEGCGFVALKRLDDARKDGNYVYAVLRGWGISSDGRGGITAPNRQGQVIALRRAYALAGYSPRLVDFIEGHGTGTPVGDQEELEAIALALNTDGEAAPRSCGVTSFKSIVGHTKAAAGVGGFIKAVIAVNRRVYPPTAGCEEPNTLFASSARSIYPIILGEARDPNATMRAAVSAMGFGGINCHATIESGDAPSTRLAPSIDERSLLVSSQESELFVLSANSVSSLLEQVQSVKKRAVGMSVAELVDLAVHLTRQLTSGRPWRAVVIASSPEKLVAHLQDLENILGERQLSPGELFTSPNKHIWIGHSVAPARIGFVFPGQGSQQINMARTLVERYDWARALVKQADFCMQEAGAEPISKFIYRPKDRLIDENQLAEWNKELADTTVAQPAICLAALLWLRYLEKLGIKPQAVGGHSLGELIAFHAAGAFPESTLLSLASVRGRAMAAPDDNAGTMASLACSPEKAAELLRHAKGDVVLANINSPKQVVASGSRAAVASVVELAQSEGIQTHPLAVSNAFHSPFVATAAKRLRKSAPVPRVLKEMTSLLLSSSDGQPITAGLKLREHFSNQVTKQVNFIALVEALTQSCDLLIEVGPGRVLSSLVNDINGTAGPLCLPVAANPYRAHELNIALACLFVNSIEIAWPALYEGRLVRPFVPSSEMIFIENPCERPFNISSVNSPQAPAASDRWIESAFADSIGVETPTLSDYLAKRGKFLAEVIRADIQTLPALSPESNRTLPSQVITPGIGLETQGDTPALDTVLVPGESLAITSPSQTFPLISNLLIDLVQQRTGFPRDTLTLELRLLDDLNLDSIKAVELIAEAAKQMGVAKFIDPPQVATATLYEIAEIIQNSMDAYEAATQIEQDGTGMPAHSQAKTLMNPESVEGRKTWVRNFVVPYVAEDISADSAAVDWTHAKAIILFDTAERYLANAIVNDLYDRSARVVALSYDEVSGQTLSDNAAFTHLIALLPRTPSLELSARQRLQNAVEHLRTAAILASTANTQKYNATVAFVQFSKVGGDKFPRTEEIDQCSAIAFAASLHFEQPHLKIRAIDFSTETDPASLSRCVLDEVSTQESYACASYDAELKRRVPKPTLREPLDYQDRCISWSHGDVIVVTGGAKGVTAECALAFARLTGVRMALVGSSPHPAASPSGQGTEEIAKTLERFNQEALTCQYYQCDVAEADAVDALVKSVREKMGVITGVIHGAAINHPRRLEMSSVEAACEEMAPKVMGALNLCRALEDAPPKLFVGLTSIIGITGMPGNAWYAFANETLDLILERFNAEHPQTSVASIAFSIWGDVGMGARLGSARNLAKLGIAVIPVEEGAARFLQLMKNDPGARQVVVTARLGGLDTWRPASHQIPSASRFLEQIITIQPGVEVVSRAHLNLATDAYLLDHNFRDSYLFPTVFGLEAMAQAIACVTNEADFNVVRIEDIRLERPIVVDPQNGLQIEIRAEVLERSSVDDPLRVRTSIGTERTGFARDHFAATFVLGSDNIAPRVPIDLSIEPLNIDFKKDIYGRLLFQGPLFQRLRQVYTLDSQRCVFSSERHSYPIIAPGEDANILTGPFLLGDPFYRDSLLQSPQLILPKDICLPVQIESIEIYRPRAQASGALIGVATMDSSSEREAYSTVYAVDVEGNVVEKLNGYYLRVVERRADNPTPEQIVELSQRKGASLDEANSLDQDNPPPAPTSNGRASLSHQADYWQQYAQKLGFDLNAYHISAEEGPQGQPALRLRFPVTFKDTANISRSIYFSQYFVWMGQVRELAMQPVFNRLAKQLATGEWGMVTNFTETEVLGTATAGDLIETRIWLDKLLEERRSTIDLIFEWQKVLPDGGHDLIGLSKMRTTWVAIRDQGIIEPQPFPEYVIDYFKSVMPGGNTHKGDRQPRHIANIDLGRELYAGLTGPLNKLILREQTFDTSLQDANLVGNIYFANYYVWQGRIRDRFMYEMFPAYFRGTPEAGELRCLYAKIEHLREAMPFDLIMVRMSLGRVNERNVQFLFDYYRMTDDGRQEKLAFGEQHAAWFTRTTSGQWEPSALPTILRNMLLAEANIEQIA